MKKITTYLLQIAGVLMLCSAMASCQQDDFVEDDGGTLPPGSHPLEFVATVGSMKTRSEGKNYWNDGDEIGVRTINTNGRKYSLFGRYTLNKEGLMMDVIGRYTEQEDGSWNQVDTLLLEWPYPKGKVSAWYPFEPQMNVAIDNQAEKGFDHLDFLSAITEEEKSFRDMVDLEFKHQMAKVTCRILPGEGITEDEFKTLWLRLKSNTTCSFKGGELTAGANVGHIIPDSTYSYVDGSMYEALLAPGELQLQDFITIGLKTRYEEQIIPKSFTHPSLRLEGGIHYTYNITVRKDRLDVSVTSAEWDDVREGQHEPTKFTFRVNLTKELVNTVNLLKAGEYVIDTNRVRLSDNVTPIKNSEGLYDKFDVLGNEFTISVEADPSSRAYNLVVVKNEATNEARIVNEQSGRSFKENNVFLIADETTLDYQEELKVGDFYFDDGSWSSLLGWENVDCIGVVFAVNEGDDPSVFKLKDKEGNEYVADRASDYAGTPISVSNRIRGYVMALKDATIWEKKTSPKGRGIPGATTTHRVRYDGVTYPVGTTYPTFVPDEDLEIEYEVINILWTNISLTFQENFGEVCSTSRNLYNGYANMESVKSNAGKAIGRIPVPEYNAFPALVAAESFETKAPTSSSGWYLPAIKQLVDMGAFLHQFDQDVSNSPISKVSGSGFSKYGYWSSTIVAVTSAYVPAYACFYGYLNSNTSTQFLTHRESIRLVLTF